VVICDRGRHHIALSMKKAVRAFPHFVFDHRDRADLPLTKLRRYEEVRTISQDGPRRYWT
jgi:hypothetical protein